VRHEPRQKNNKMKILGFALLTPTYGDEDFTLLENDKLSYFFSQLKLIYTDMDRTYKVAGDYYGFHCRGCEDNCCLTRFYHYTFLEYYYILKGWDELLPEKQREIKEKASEVCKKTAELNEKNQTVRLMCPLNDKGLCLVYDYRPMICRLHGISHELHRLDGQVILGPGCESFTKLSEGKRYFRFDRTPFYVKMANLENDLKKELGITHKIKMTVAEMIVN